MKIYIEKELFQWEKNRYVFIEGFESSSPIFVQFYNGKMNKSIENPIKGNKVKIPDVLLEECIPIMALVCSGSIEDSQVLSRREFKVIKRAKPGITPTPDVPDVPDIPDSDREIIYDGGEET